LSDAGFLDKGIDKGDDKGDDKGSKTKVLGQPLIGASD
jgi:hypothetical protein